MSEESLETILKQYLPSGAVAYCVSLWRANPFHLKITRSRFSKAGDFYCSASELAPRITLNNDLNHFLFLVTYVHEVAHLHMYHRYKRTRPHGKEWKKCFQDLMHPLLQETIFPEPLLSVLRVHMHNPKASSFADATLTKTFRMFDPKVSDVITVDDLPEGSYFVIRGKHFKKGKLKRTRFLCDEVKSKRKYLVPAEAIVSEVQLQMF